MDIASQFEPINRWLNSLQERERHIVIYGSIALVVILFYLLVWDPVFSTLDSKRQQHQSQRQLLSWMKDTAQEIKQLQSSGASTASRYRNQSVSSLVERSATSTGIKPFIKKLESNKKGVKAQIELVDFDRMVVWLNDLKQKYAIQVSKIIIEPQKAPGSVNARVTLERADS